MSELEEHLFCECDECIREYRGPLSNEMRPYYIKSEADTVIAELENRIDDGDKDFEIADHQNERLLKIVRHQKYKRCINKAEWCEERCARYDLLQEHSGFSWRREIDFYFGWYLRWLELAEKFKEAK